jgi:cytochrome P450 family 103
MGANYDFPVTADGCVEATFEALIADPLGVFAWARERSPVIRIGNFYLVISGPHVLEMLTDSRTMQMEGAMFGLRGMPMDGPFGQHQLNSVLLSNGEVHARRRAPLARAFAKPIVEKMRPWVHQEASQIAEALPRGEPFDFLEQFASPLPGRVIARVVGLDPDRWREFAQHVYTMVSGFAPPYEAERWRTIEAAVEALYTHCTDALRDRREKPSDDFLTAFAQAADGAGVLSEMEIRQQLLAILLAGSDTTRGALCYQQGLLLEDRSRWETLKADRSLIPAAISECLRLEPPVAAAPRFAPQDIQVGTATIAAGSPYELITLSAMRDPAVYPDPERFDMHRSGGPRLLPSFGGGAHRCIGEYLARIELQEALEVLLDRHPDIELTAPRVPARGYTAIREAQPLWCRIPA